MEQLEKFRKDKDQLFGHNEQSPLTPEQKKVFEGLKYFNFNPDLIFKNIPVEKVATQEIIAIKTSVGDNQNFKILGKISFSVSGKLYHLNIYESVDNGSVFLPFRDQTNQEETYHDGRFVEVEIKNNEIEELDFNYAYNPYCAYNDNFRCPITPIENSLDVRIEAGEKRF